MALGRVLVAVDSAHRKTLKAGQMLTRDAREVERKKYGRHKARRRPQFSKR
jgi:small subunit ribosomal protein S9